MNRNTLFNIAELAADFENIIYRTSPIKDAEHTEHLAKIKHAGDECADQAARRDIDVIGGLRKQRGQLHGPYLFY